MAAGGGAEPGAPLQQGAAIDAAAGRGGPASVEQLAQLLAAARVQLHRKDYVGAIDLAQRYVKMLGPEADVRPVLIDAYFHSGDHANAARELQKEVQTAERSGQTPGEDRLLLLRKCYGQLNDANATAWLLEKLVSYHPKKDYWADLLERMQKRPDFGERLALDVQRLRLLTGTLANASAYIDMANLALGEGFPAEASRTVERGFAVGVLGSGPDAGRHRLLRQQLAQFALVQRQELGQAGSEAAAARARDGNGLVNLGFAHVTQGDFDKGLALMEQGLRKGGLGDRPQDARLHLGIAYLMAGQVAKASAAFSQVSGRHGAADLARIWNIYAQHVRKNGS